MPTPTPRGPGRRIPSPDCRPRSTTSSRRRWRLTQTIDMPVPGGSPIEVAGQPDAVAVGFGSIWVADTTDNSVLRLDPRQSPTPVQIPVGAHPSDVAVGGGWVWVTNERGDSVSRVDPSTNRVDK